MRIARAALILSFGNILSRLLGLAREQVIAALFGRTGATDVFTAAWRIPTSLYDLLVGGAISAALVPVLAEARDDRSSFARLLCVLLTTGAIVLAAATAVAVLLADPIMALWAPGQTTRFSDGAASGPLLLRLMLPALFFLGLSGIVTAILYAQERFLLPALAASAFNAAIVLGALATHNQLGILSLCLGLVLGGLVQLGVQLPGLRGLALRPAFDFSHPALPRIVKLYAPVALGLVVSTVGVGIDTNLASTTPAGDLTAMRYATTLVQFPLGLVATALSFAVLPALSRATHEFADTLGLGLRLAWLAIIPATVGLVVLREPVVRLLFERGAFGPDDTARTALAFLYYSPGIPAAAIDQLLIFAFYARKNTVTPVLVGVAAVGIYVGTGVTLVGPFGMPGLAVANSVQWIGHAVLMTLLLGRVLPRGPRVAVTAGMWRPVLAALVMAVILIPFQGWFGTAVARSTDWMLGLFLVLAATLGAGVYAATLVVLRTPELSQAADRLRARVQRNARREAP